MTVPVAPLGESNSNTVGKIEVVETFRKWGHWMEIARQYIALASMLRWPALAFVQREAGPIHA